MSVSHVVIHCKHVGCYEVYETDEFGPVTHLNMPIIYFFNCKESAVLFFKDYIKHLSCSHTKCVQPDPKEYVVGCGTIYSDDDDNNLYYIDHTHQIYILETSSQMYTPNLNVLNAVNAINKLNNQKKMCKTFGQEQKQQMIELGKMCEDSFI
jgi:hypothetical protein